MDHPNEFLISVSGTYGAEYGLEIVQSITFISNMRSYGPFGLKKGTHFNLASAGDKLAGFHGRCGFYLDSIGAHKEPIPMSYQYEIIDPKGWKSSDIWDDGVYTTVR